MNELELSLSGLAKKTSDKAIGNLITADLILTGTLADLGNTWDVNLRLVNVRTGQAMASIAMRTPLIKPLEMRDSGPLNEKFNEDTLDPSWRLGFREWKCLAKEVADLIWAVTVNSYWIRRGSGNYLQLLKNRL